MNQTSEYWYIGSMFASSDMQKKRTEACELTDLYRFRVLSISVCVSSAARCFAEISSDSRFEDCRICNQI